ncbi:MAG: ABC transporter permease [Dehalococcoidia bacterium]
MLRYTLRRLAWLPIILFGVSAIAFFVLRAIPGQDPAAAIAGQGATEVQLERIRSDLGLQRPVVVQYFDWLGNLVRGDFGHEFKTASSTGATSGLPIREQFMERFPESFQIIFLGLFFSVVFGISFGILSAMHRNSPIDYFVRFFAVLASSIPEFFLLTLMIILPLYFWNYSQPVGGYVPFYDNPMHYIRLMLPPALIIGVGGSAGLMRLTRTTMLEVLLSDYVRTARAKGLRQHTVVLSHALRNAGTPIVTAVGTAFIAVFGGSIIVESVLSIQGLGQWFFISTLARDLPVVQFLTVYTAFIVVLVNLTVDLSYGFIDPRVRYS